MAIFVGSILLFGSPFKVVFSVVSTVAIEMTTFMLSGWAWSDER
jgi:hypothetical protein